MWKCSKYIPTSWTSFLTWNEITSPSISWFIKLSKLVMSFCTQRRRLDVALKKILLGCITTDYKNSTFDEIQGIESCEMKKT